MLADLFPWLQKRPAAIFIILALLLMVLGHFLEGHAILGPLRSFTAYLERSLESFDATRIGGTFYRELTGCDLKDGAVACTPGPDTTDDLINGLQGKPQSSLLGSVLAAIINTVTTVFGQATVLGIVVYVVALMAAAVLLATVLDFEEAGPLGIVAIVILTPAAASLAALALKWVLLLFVLLFSEVLAGIAWCLTPLGVVYSLASSGNEVLTTAHHIEKMTTGANNEPPPDAGH